ncbi:MULTISPECIES: ATP-dependent RNA helicase HrpA [Protofrankia]|uniref:RNA helicase n=1 Tax=Candidatus Protofrankia datiscae TaxID=2716812 RepID=F8B2E5_9ACTN|nr:MULTISPECIES: ATP-dependent RNA helicase HrpA [Protofrankia]AEH10822.1 ATP-dependent helicase HrpA [Candidatus Protofrankia datiscae]
MPPLAELAERLPDLMVRDQRRLQRRVDGARRIRNPQARAAVAAEIAADVEAATLRVQRRLAAVPPITYPPDLPVSQRRDDIRAAIRDHQVVILAGETGSGKTTQLPKICLELGRGVRGLIGHTQPRRLAARAVAERVAEELDGPDARPGATVGYKVRFTDEVGDNSLIKLMTDGILLAEIQTDRLLSQYDTLIVDEAHERSLNIDFILGYLRQLLPRRPDLKVVITSATIDPQRFARHFGDAPVIEVTGRTFPVEVRYRPLVVPAGIDAGASPGTGDGDGPGAMIERDLPEAITSAVDELCAAGPGDILVFLSGEREIRDTADVLAKRQLPNTEIVPLYARLSAAEQHRVFQPHSGRRIVLATNVAETSLTVPGIRYVVDPGLARVSRYSNRTKVQRLPIEAISQASANQRRGRCGRVADGICIRLYSEDDFDARPRFTDPEILRTNLASVILQMTALGLGDMADFPFIDPPDSRSISDGVLLLRELGAVETASAPEQSGKPAAPDRAGARMRLTPLGRKLAQIPLDPRLARMVLAAGDNGCVREVMVIASALSIQDPRERPVDAQQAAAEKHGRFTDRQSDFLAYLNMWEYLREQQEQLSGNQFRRLCRADFLNYLRVREWQDVHGQLRQIVKSLGIPVGSTPADPQNIHLALLAGLLSHIGVRDADKQEYQGARGSRFAVFPGSALFRKPPRWLVAAELVETSRLWARTVARIEPEWAEALAPHLVKRTYSEPHWEKKQAAVVAFEKVTLYGLPLVTSRRVNYSAIDPALCRDLFIRHALVEGDWQTHHAFFHDNRRLLDDVEELEHRARRRDIVVDDDTLFDFYDQRLPADVVSGRHFDSWWKKARRSQPDLLAFSASMLVRAGADGVDERDYPDAWRHGELTLALSYQFAPGTDADGVTVRIPLPLLNQVSADGFDWQVPGLRAELVTALIRSLPKQIRRSFVPAPDYAARVLAAVTPADGPLLAVLERELDRLTGVAVPRESWQLDRVADHLKITFRVVDEEQRTLAEGKDLAALVDQLAPTMRAAVCAVADGVERDGLRTWDFDALPQLVERQHPGPGRPARAYPALLDQGRSVAIRVFATEAEARQAMWLGTRRLLLLNMPSPIKQINARLSNTAKLTLSHHPYHGVVELLDDCVACAADKLIAAGGGPGWDADGFAKLRGIVQADLDETAFDVVTKVERILATAHTVSGQLADWQARVQPQPQPGRSREPARRAGANAGLAALAPALDDIRSQLSGLVYPGFVSATGWQRLPDIARYLAAIERRLEKLPSDPDRDRQRMLQVEQVTLEHQRLLDRTPPDGPHGEELQRIRWMIEELRVGLFAQTLRTAYPISAERIFRALDQLPL